ncbi:MAG: serine hydrolase [Verrucomicrobia bacterium]|nr:serine hydrolase [Verrucomicrobiota bacterium]
MTMTTPMKSFVTFLVGAVCLTAGQTHCLNAGQPPAPDLRMGPLRVHPANPRYFADNGQRAIYLTGSHTWHVLQDQGPSYPPQPFDFDAFITFLRTNHHNFFRMWTWEHSRWACWSTSDKFWYRPAPYRRIEGHGIAQDGLPKFDLTEFDPEYFQRLSNRVDQARSNGIYVAVMLFQGVSVEFKKPHYKLPWNSHPYHRSNNVNQIDADTNGDGQGYDFHQWPLAPGVWDLQRAYLRKVIDAVNGFDNVLYEVANECHTNSQTWQYEVIKFIKNYEATSKPRRHPVGMTAEYPNGGTTDLFASPADWISPSVADWDKDAPPVATGHKVILADTDHLPGQRGDADFVWKAFTRGNHPIVMDDLAVTNAARISARRAMGVTRRLAERLDLAAATPHGEVTSSGYCLAHPGQEYVLFLPAGGEVSVDLSAAAGQFRVEWIHPVKGTLTRAETLAGGAKRTLKAPFAGQAVVHLTASPATGGASMAFPGRDWAETTPESQGVEAARLREAVAWLDNHSGPDGAKELVIIRNGYLIWKGPHADAYHKIFSCTKVFTSTVLGLLVDDGKCRLDDRAVQFLPSLDEEQPAYAQITLRHLASMSGGYRGVVREVSPEQPWGEPLAYLVPQPPRYESGTACAYHDHDVFLLGNILARLAQQPLKETFQRRIADPIGMKHWDWGVVGVLENGMTLNNAAGTPARNPGIQTTALDLARLGHLYLNRGHWNGRQLLSVFFVDQATTSQVPASRPHATGADPGGHYGFYWWLNTPQRNGRCAWPAAPPRTYAARGASANSCFVVPEWNMVMVRLATAPENSKAADETWNTFFSRLAPAVSHP